MTQTHVDDPDGVDMTPLAEAVREFMDERADKGARIRRDAQRYMDEQRQLREHNRQEYR